MTPCHQFSSEACHRFQHSSSAFLLFLATAMHRRHCLKTKRMSSKDDVALARDAATASANFAARKHAPPDEAMSQQEREAAELDEARRQEAERQAKRDAEIEASWQKRILVEGTGAQAYRGAQARLHVVGRAHVDQHVTGRAAERGFVSGSIFEDSRARDCPLLLLLGRGLLVPGLDRCVLGMRVGERAEVTIAPEGGYGAAGSVANPMVPGSATLTYDVELLTVEKEIELWDMSFEDKMRLAAERKQRGNTLVSSATSSSPTQSTSRRCATLYSCPIQSRLRCRS